MHLRRIVLCLLLIGTIRTSAIAQDLTIAAASDLQFAMQDIASRFKKETGKSVKVIYGSSGNFAQQIQNGAPFDLFFSANIDYPKQLEAANLTEPSSMYQYARGKLVIWAPKGSAIDVKKGLAALASPEVKKVAIANPAHAPYGKAAVAALQKENLYDKVKDKLVLGENISQTASFVLSGAADVGLIALSLATSPNMKDKGSYVEVASDDYPPIEQACVILRSSKNKEEAKKFLDFMKRPVTAELLRSYGFQVGDK